MAAPFQDSPYAKSSRTCLFPELYHPTSSSVIYAVLQNQTHPNPHGGTQNYASGRLKRSNEPLPLINREVKPPTEMLSLLRLALQPRHVQDDVLKQMLFARLAPIFQYYLWGYVPLCTSDQLAHVADIVYASIYGCPDYRPFIVDRLSGTAFLVDTGSAHSIIPATDRDRAYHTAFGNMIAPVGSDVKVYSRKYLTLNLGDGQLRTWPFLIADIRTPVIGSDFLSNFNLLISIKMKELTKYQSSIKLPNAITKNRCPPAIPELMSKVMLQNMDGCEKPSEIFHLMHNIFTKEYMQGESCKMFFLKLLPDPIQRHLTSDILRHGTLRDLVIKADIIYDEVYYWKNHCLFITDQNSGFKFLIDSGAHISQVPRLPHESLAPIPFFRLLSANGHPITEYGYKFLLVNLGVDVIFPWNFIVTNNTVPLIGADFLHHFNLKIDLRRKRLILNTPK
nr:gag pol polyprotein [Hymenolepis microstoma]